MLTCIAVQQDNNSISLSVPRIVYDTFLRERSKVHVIPLMMPLETLTDACLNRRVIYTASLILITSVFIPNPVNVYSQADFLAF